MEPSENFYLYLERTAKILVSTILVFLLMFLAKNCYAQGNIKQVPASQEFRNINQIIKVYNVRFDEIYSDYNCKWETSHAEVNGLPDGETQNYINDWLLSMTYFGNCESDKTCFDYKSFHYYFKITQVTFFQNNLVSMFLKEGNCEKEDERCCEAQDWEIYDIDKRRFLVESDFLKQDAASKHAFNKLIEQKVHLAGYQLTPNWQDFAKQVGIDNQQLVVYLYDDVVNHPYGLVVRFSQNQVENYLQGNYANRIWGKFLSMY